MEFNVDRTISFFKRAAAENAKEIEKLLRDEAWLQNTSFQVI